MTFRAVKRAGPKPHQGSRNQNEQRLMVVIAFCSMYAISLGVAHNTTTLQGLLAPSIVVSLSSLYSFFYSGGKRIVATTVLSYGILIFIAFPPIYSSLGLYSTSKVFSYESVLHTLNLAFFLQVVTFMVATKMVDCDTYGQSETSRDCNTSDSAIRLSLALSLLAFGANWVLRVIGVSLGSSVFGWLAMLFAANAAFDSEKRKIRPFGSVILLLMLMINLGTDPGGFGRLNLAVQIVSVAILASIKLRTWWVKVVTIMMTAPALVYLASQRLKFIEKEQARIPGESEGIGSVVGPFHSAATIVEAYSQGQINMAFGATIFAAAVVWIPRALWPAKPEGFGREIVEVTQPWMVSVTEHSDAATILGEAVWNFGTWGAIGFLIAVALLAGRVDRAIIGGSVSFSSIREVSTLLIFIIIAASFMNVVWGGAFTATSRLFLPLLLLLMVRFIAIKKPRHGYNFYRSGKLLKNRNI